MGKKILVSEKEKTEEGKRNSMRRTCFSQKFDDTVKDTVKVRKRQGSIFGKFGSPESLSHMVSIYVYIYIYIYVYVFTIYSYSTLYLCKCICIHMYIYVYIYTYEHTCICINMYILTYAHIGYECIRLKRGNFKENHKYK
jgi:hypothetical protein